MSRTTVGVGASIRASARAAGLLWLVGCTGGPDPTETDSGNGGTPSCDLEARFLAVGAAIDGIPSIDDPAWVSSAGQVPGYLEEDTRVIGLEVVGVAYAVPHNVLWFHEVVNIDVAGERLAITYCPLTGSSLAFDRSAAGGATFGVSGLLFKNNLILYDRNDPESHWPQMLGEARCGPRGNTPLSQWPVVELTWSAWLELHPGTLVLSADQGYAIDYSADNYPYGSYEDHRVTSFLFRAMPDLDHRRPTKERVLGIPPERGLDRGAEPGEGETGIAFPFGALTSLPGPQQVVPFTSGGEPAFVLWSDAARGGMAFRGETDRGDRLTLVAADGEIVDSETGSVWNIEGRALSGPLEGSRLLPLNRTYVAFWGAWAAFFPTTRLWEG